MDTKTDGPAWLQRRHWLKAPPGARASRPHNAGTTSPISSSRLDRQQPHDSASSEPKPFPPAGWPGAASRENGAATQRRGCGRDARAPGGAPPPILLAPRGGTAPANAAAPSRFACLRGPSCVFVDHSLSVCFSQFAPLPRSSAQTHPHRLRRNHSEQSRAPNSRKIKGMSHRGSTWSTVLGLSA